MLLQHASELAIRAAVFLAQQSPGKLSPVREVAASAGVPEPYLAKIFQRLTRAGLVRSFRGPGKGMELGRAPAAITLASLIYAMEGRSAVERCLFGLSTCPDKFPCPAHAGWVPLRSAIRDFLEQTTLADLIGSVPAVPGNGSAKPRKPSGIPAKRGAGQQGRLSI